MDIIKKVLLVLSVVFYSSMTIASCGSDEVAIVSAAAVVAPQNYLSDFPNEEISIQTLGVTHVSNDVVIPGNAGMDIVVTRRVGGSQIKFDRIILSTSNVYAADDPVYNLTCLGDFQDLSISINGKRLTPTGYDSTSQIPASGFAFFSNGSYFKCEGSTPTLHFSDGKKHSFTQVRQAETDYYLSIGYYVDVVTDRHGNTITYGYEDDVLPASYNAPKLLKTITRSDGQVVNFVYEQTNTFSRSHVVEINYSGKKIEYIYVDVDGDGDKDFKFIDAEGRETIYTFAGYTGGSKIDTVTTPEGLVVDYLFGAYTQGLGLVPLAGESLPAWVSEGGESGGQLVEKSISGPGVETKWYQYAFATNSKTLVVQKDYKGELDLTTEYVVKYGRLRNWVGQIASVRGFEGEYASSGNIQAQYGTHNLLYELTNTWEQINSGVVGCHQATDTPIYDSLDCRKYELSNTELKIKNTNVFDTFTTDIGSFNIYGQPLTTTQSFGTKNKVITQSYDHDVSNWILNQPRITKLGSSAATLENVKEFTYYAKGHSSYPFMPYEEKSFGIWQKKYSEYFADGSSADGSIKKIEYNQKLAYGDTSANRYQTFASYKRGKPQTFTYPNRYTSGSMSDTQVIDNDGRVTQTTDLNDNVIQYGYDNIGRLTYIDPADENLADTLYTWTYDGGLDSNQAKSVVSHCTANAAKTACSDAEKLTVTTTYDGRLRPVQIVTTDIAKQNSIYQNFAYNHFSRNKFVSFPSSSSGETKGITYDYDGLQRLTSETVSNGGSQATSYLSGNRVKVNNFNSYDTTTTYLAYGEPSYAQATYILSPEGVTTSLAENVFGEVESISQLGAHKATTISQTQTNLYNSAHQLCMVKRNDVGNTYYQRNNLGEVTWQAQGLSGTTCAAHGATATQKLTLGYDNLGRQRTITYGDSSPDVTYTLDNNGDLDRLVSGNVIQTYDYNSARLLEWETLALDSKSFTLDYDYDSLGALSSLTYPDNSVGKVDFAPNAFGQATKATRIVNSVTTNYATAASYYANGIINTFTYGNGLTHKTTLNTRNMPSEIKDYTGTNNRVKLSYTYDDQNNIKKVIDFNSAYSLTNLNYDGLDRLTSTTGGSSIGSSVMSYDAIGNILSYSNTSSQKNSALSYTYNLTSNRLTGVSGTGSAGYDFSQTSSYDGRGNVRNNGMRSFIYNLANQMTSSAAGNSNNSYVYDGYNRRVKTTDSKGTSYSMYSQSGRLLYREVNGDPVNYIFLGSKLIAKEGGIPKNVNSRMHYKPFGDSIETPKDDVGYTGHKFDTDLGLSYMQARYYDPVIGRFYSNDPVGFTGEVDTFNRYSYVANNPYKYTDPDGNRKQGRGAGMTHLVATIGEATGLLTPRQANRLRKIANASQGKLSTRQLRGGNFNKAKSERIQEANGKCEYCQNANATQGDHAKTLNSFKNDVNGGKMTASEAKTVANSKDNIVASCKQCNQVDKHTKDLGTGPNQYNPPNPNMRVQTMLKGN